MWSGPWHEYMEGLRYMRSTPLIFAIGLVGVGWATGGGAAQILFSLFGERVQAAPPVDRKVLGDRVPDDRMREPVPVTGRTDAIEQPAGHGVVDGVEPGVDRKVRVVDRQQGRQVELGADDGGQLRATVGRSSTRGSPDRG